MKAVIQAGGKGTRISSITGDTIPKPMLEVSGYPILYHQIMNLKKSGIKDIIIIVGHLGNIIKQYFKDGTNFGVNISYVDENPDFLLGTAGSLYNLKDKIKDDFIFLLADVFIDVDFERMYQFHKAKNADVTLLTHPNDHPFDSDLVVVDKDDKVLSFDHKTNDRTNYNYHNLVNAGVMIFSANTLKYIEKEQSYSYEKDIIEPLIKDGKVFSYKSSEYAKDMGTPERYKKVQEDYINGLPAIRNLKHKQKCVFLDRDGTINKYVGFLTDVDKVELIDGSALAIKKINNSEYLCIVVTNQPVVARGDITVAELENINMRMEKLLGHEGAYINALYYCPHHPDKGYDGEVKELKINCECRKPKTGMLKQAVQDFNIDLKNSIVIGDSTLDIKMAENAGMKSILVKTGQSGLDNKYEVVPTYVAENLLDAVNYFIDDLEEK